MRLINNLPAIIASLILNVYISGVFLFAIVSVKSKFPKYICHLLNCQDWPIGMCLHEEICVAFVSMQLHVNTYSSPK